MDTKLRRRAGRSLNVLGLATGMVLALAAGAVAAATNGKVLIDAKFGQPTTTAAVVPISKTQGLPCLTAGMNVYTTPLAGCGFTTTNAPDLTHPVQDLPGSGVLRLTNAIKDELSGIQYKETFQTRQGLSVEFKTYMYGGVGANVNGESFYLAVAKPAPTELGGTGGALGYAPNLPAVVGPPGVNGLSGGYLGIGFDPYGEYSDSTTDGAGCPTVTGRTANHLYQQAITARGAGNLQNGYCVLTSTAFPTAVTPAIVLDGANRAASVRGVKIVIDGVAKTYTVGYDPAGGTNYTTVLSGPLPTGYYNPDSGTLVSGLPEALTFGFIGSVGGGGTAAVHEIGSVYATTLKDDDDHGHGGHGGH